MKVGLDTNLQFPEGDPYWVPLLAGCEVECAYREIPCRMKGPSPTAAIAATPPATATFHWLSPMKTMTTAKVMANSVASASANSQRPGTHIARIERYTFTHDAEQPEHIPEQCRRDQDGGQHDGEADQNLMEEVGHVGSLAHGLRTGLRLLRAVAATPLGNINNRRSVNRPVSVPRSEQMLPSGFRGATG